MLINIAINVKHIRLLTCLFIPGDFPSMELCKLQLYAPTKEKIITSNGNLLVMENSMLERISMMITACT